MNRFQIQLDAVETRVGHSGTFTAFTGKKEKGEERIKKQLITTLLLR